MQTPKENPFLGLKPYGVRDQLYGRDKDLFLMTDRIFCARTTLLFAGSGVGKTSFINAKIIPELKSQYSSIIYHNQWTIGPPLENLLKSISNHLPAAAPRPAVVSQTASPVKPPSFFVNNRLAFHLQRFMNEEHGSEDTITNRCLLILDQFEEIFQYHHGKNPFDTFIRQLAELINYKNCNVRVLFSMREEFLGELSVFDNKIPDLFSNYYRLKCPNKQEAINIIESTCSLVDMAVEEEQLVNLVGDLTKIAKAESTTKQDQNGNEASQDLDIVAPPYLQIACKQLWERQFNSANGSKPLDAAEARKEKFLSNYKRGEAREMLKSFCEEILNGFNKRDRALLAEAFNYLVTKQGAKMAYALPSLVEHMGVKERRLESVLHRLSDPGSRILRESNGPDGALWYELYHDMYGKIIDEWRRAYRLQRKAESNRRLIAAAGVIVVIALLTTWTWQWLDRRQHRRETLRSGDLSKQLSYLNSKQAFEDLRDTWHSGTTAKQLWADAWERRATFAERTEDSQQAFLSLLKAAEVYPPSRTDPALLSQIRSYLDSDEYAPLLASYRLEIGVTTSPAFKPILTADGKMLLSIGSDRQVFFWDSDSYQLKLRSPQLSVDGPTQSNPYGPGPPSLSQHATVTYQGASATQIQAATENLIGGLDNNKFCIWDARTGQKLWQSDSQSGPKAQISKLFVPGEADSYAENSFKQSVEQPSFSFSSNGRYFATSNGANAFLLYRVSDNNKAELLEKDLMGSVTKMQFSPDGHNVALVFKDGTAQLRDLDTNSSRSLAIDGQSIRRIIFSSDGLKFIADMGVMKPAEIWSTSSGSKIQTTSPTMGDLFFCPDNKTIASILPINQLNTTIIGIRFWNSEKGPARIRATKFDERTEYIINPNGKSLLTIGVSGSARLWSLEPPAASANDLITDTAQILVSDISDDGKVIVSVNNNQKLNVWNADSLAKTAEFPLTATVPLNGDDFLFPVREHVVDDLVVSPSGKYVCLKTSLGKFSLRKLQDYKEITHGTFDTNGRPAAFSPNQEAFAVADQQGSITLWEHLDETPSSTSLSMNEDVYGLVFSPDGKYLAAIGNGGFSSRYVRVFEVGSGKEMPLPTEGFTSTIALGRNGIFIGTILNDDTAVLVWDSAKGRSQKLWHDTGVTAVALNHDSTYAITSTSNGILQLWDIATGKPVASGPCSTRILSLMISEDGKTLVALSDKWLHVHSISKEALSYLDGREIVSPASVRILDPTGKKLRNLFPAVQDSLKVKSFDFSSAPSGNDPVGSAAHFFSIWSKKLALDFDQNGRVTPVHPRNSAP